MLIELHVPLSEASYSAGAADVMMVPPAQCVTLLSPEKWVLAFPQCLQKPREKKASLFVPWVGEEGDGN